MVACKRDVNGILAKYPFRGKLDTTTDPQFYYLTSLNAKRPH